MRTNFLLFVGAALLIGFGGGYFAGRHSHHYVHLGAAGVLMYDENTGHICNGRAKSKNPIDASLPAGFALDSNSGKNEDDPNKDVFDKLAERMKKEEAANEIPYCGEE